MNLTDFSRKVIIKSGQSAKKISNHHDPISSIIVRFDLYPVHRCPVKKGRTNMPALRSSQ
jgi:hypothetical protein